MDWQSGAYALTLIVAGALNAVLAAVALRRRPVGYRPFVVLLLALVVWALGATLEMLGSELGPTLFWARFQWFGIVTVPVAWVLFSLRYSGVVQRLRRTLVGALATIPVVTLIILWSPGVSHWIWPSAGMSSGAGDPYLVVDHGFWFWVHLTYSYILYGVGAVLLVGALLRSPRPYRRQAAPLSIAVLVPWIGNVVHLAGLGPAAVDATPLAFSVSGLALSWAMLRDSFLEVIPVAREEVVEEIRDGVLVLDEDLRIVDLNPAAEEIFRTPRRTLLGRSVHRLFRDRPALVGLLEGERERQSRVFLEEGERQVFDVRSWPLERVHGGTGRLLVFRDVTEHEVAAEEWRQSEQRLSLLVGQIPALLWVTDADLHVTMLRGAALRDVDLDPIELVGAAVLEVFSGAGVDKELTEAHARALAGEASTCEISWRGRDFECHVEARKDPEGEVVGTIGVALDVTERRSLQEQLRQSQKMEAVGRMAGGIAHDFNNLLTAVAGYAELAQEDLDRIHEGAGAINDLGRDLEAIRNAAERATSLTSQLMVFSRRQQMQLRRLDLNEVVQEMAKMVRRLMGGRIDLTISLEEEPRRILADPVQTQQLIVNLVLNARDAMPAGGGLTIETARVEVAEPRATRHGVIESGDYMTLTIGDEGFGMDEDTLDRLFEPFFTTKPEGEGTGLGLSAVYGIVSQSEGHVEVESELGAGTTFRLYFPLAKAEDDELVEPADEETALRGRETVLLVDDEEMVRGLGARLLRGYGYEVLEATDSVDALELCAEHPGGIDLLITDVVMPGMSGKDLAGRVKAINPRVRVLFVSGYTGHALVEHGILDARTEFLQKPFSPQVLARTVRRILDEQPAGAGPGGS